MPHPLISIHSFCNYAEKLTAGSVTERASVQAIFNRITQHLHNEFPNEDLTMMISPAKNVASNDEIYNLTDSLSPTGVHIYIFSEITSPIRSLVLNLTTEVAIEMFGKLSQPATYTLTTISQFAATLVNSEQLEGTLIATPAEQLADHVAHVNAATCHLPKLIMMLPDHNWYCLTEYHSDGTPKLVVINRSEYQKFGISDSGPLKQDENVIASLIASSDEDPGDSQKSEVSTTDEPQIAAAVVRGRTRNR